MTFLTKDEIDALIDAKIREHEFRIGLISGIAGILLLPAFIFVIVVCLLNYLQ
jgi:hypothetical protein